MPRTILSYEIHTYMFFAFMLRRTMLDYARLAYLRFTLVFPLPFRDILFHFSIDQSSNQSTTSFIRRTSERKQFEVSHLLTTNSWKGSTYMVYVWYRDIQSWLEIPLSCQSLCSTGGIRSGSLQRQGVNGIPTNHQIESYHGYNAAG